MLGSHTPSGLENIFISISCKMDISALKAIVRRFMTNFTRIGIGRVLHVEVIRGMEQVRYTHVKNDLQVRTEKHEKQIKTKKKKFHELLKLFFLKSRKIDTQTHRKCFKKIFQTYPVKILSDPVHVMRSLYVSILL